MPFIKGFRFIVSGRLTRKERAFFIVKSVRRMPLSSHDCRIDSAADFKIMKFGVVGIKIYLLYTETPPFYYFFEFKNKI
jgi:ribosomal protein S3